jgi:pilus assembly protein Flp/PilA
LNPLTTLFKNQDGATAIEYGLIAALIAIAAVVALGATGSSLIRTRSSRICVRSLQRTTRTGRTTCNSPITTGS